MRRGFYFSTLLLVLLTALMLTCNRKHDPPVAPSSDASPQIVEVQINGVPSENIIIDQPTKTITVYLPAGWKKARVQPWFTANNGARWAPTDYSLICLCGCSSEVPVQIGSKFSTYRIRFITVEKPTIKSVAGTLDYAIGESNEPLVVSIDHAYAPSDSIQLRLRKVGEPTTVTFNCANGNMQYDWRDGTVNLKPYVYTGIAPGEYTIELPWSDGGASLAKQTLIIRKGKAELRSFIPFANVLISGQPTILLGANLFKDDIEVVLKSTDSNEYRLKPTQNAVDGSSITLTPASNIAPGYYQLRLFQDGQERSCYRAAVTRYANQPTVGKLDLYTKNPGCALTEEPLVYQRGEQGNFMGNLSPDNLSQQVELTSLSDLRRSVLLPINTNVIESFPKFTIPANLTPGRYRLTLQVLTKDKQTLESEPYERVVEIQ